jgi:hypothetical protein
MIEERWLPPEIVRSGEGQPSPIAVQPQPGGSTATISVAVQVSLTEQARERVAEQAIARAAETHQRHIEIVARRLFNLDQEIAMREAERRILYRR